ncbi:hypothetical protein chiPu_0022320 [Chiloscyllium punctatum]|uniref:Uncharacterized protein n=1 Tax=Chiloscyllium punctatum TaxID=137246 RepID=A0A401RI19_CHIPU|nr:hypothetical protein [Chiloscyllium punctatum]
MRTPCFLGVILQGWAGGRPGWGGAHRRHIRFPRAGQGSFRTGIVRRQSHGRADVDWVGCCNPATQLPRLEVPLGWPVGGPSLVLFSAAWAGGRRWGEGALPVFCPAAAAAILAAHRRRHRPPNGRAEEASPCRRFDI